jgi:hypothetical protein
MNTLILSLDAYSWVRNCAGIVSRTPDSYQLFVIFRDDMKPMCRCNKICSEATYVQRMYDLFKIGKELGVKKVYNMNYCEDDPIDIESLIMKLHLSILIGGAKRIIFEDNNILKVALLKMCKEAEVELFSYNPICDYKLKDIIYIDLSQKEIEKKMSLSEHMVGIHNTQELPSDSNCEVLYKVGGKWLQ